MKAYQLKSYQKGISLMVMLLTLIIISSTLFITTINPFSLESNKKQQTRNELAIAKQSLIAYAATHYEVVPGEFGVLPCPDMSTALSEGEQDGNCGATDTNVVGRFPWRTLDVGPLKDITGECLWYIVSGPYKKSPQRTFLNADVPGLLEMYASDGATILAGLNAEDRPVAAIIAPGLPITQNRFDEAANDVPNCGGSYDTSLYLEATGLADNANLSGNVFNIDEIAQGPFSTETIINDQVAFITAGEIWDAIQSRSDYIDKFKLLTEQIALCIAEYGNHNLDGELRLPWAAPLGPFGGATGYHDDNNYNDVSNLYAGRVPFLVYDSVTDTNSNYPAQSGPQTEDLFHPPAVATACEQFTTDRSDDEVFNLWTNWKDHLFYAVSQARSPASAPAANCLTESCLTVNGGNQYGAIVIFAGRALNGQTRTGPPDPDTRSTISNYLEDNNDITLMSEDGDGDYTYRASDDTFDDILYCIDENLIVNECPT